MDFRSSLEHGLNCVLKVNISFGLAAIYLFIYTSFIFRYFQHFSTKCSPGRGVFVCILFLVCIVFTPLSAQLSTKSLARPPTHRFMNTAGNSSGTRWRPMIGGPKLTHNRQIFVSFLSGDNVNTHPVEVFIATVV